MRKFYFLVLALLLGFFGSYAARTTALTGGGNAASAICATASNKVIYSWADAQGSTANSINSLSFATVGTYAAADVTSFQVWHSTSATFSTSTATSLGTITTALGAGTHTLTGLTYAPTVSATTYFYITINTPATVTNGDTLRVSALLTSNITWSTTPATYTTACTISGKQSIYTSPAAITGGPSICSGTPVTLSDATSSGTWSVTAGTGAASITAGGVITGSSAGTVTVSYVTTGSTAACAATAAITVGAPPAAITGATSVCNGSAITLANSVTGGTWTITAGSGTATITAGGVLTGTGVGTVTANYTTSGCTPATYGVTVNTQPTALTGTQTICLPGTTTFASTPTGGTWTSGSPGVATVSGGTVTGVTAGTALISYAIGTCQVTRTATVTSAPVAFTGGSSSICASTVLSQNFTSLTGQTGGTWTVTNTGTSSAYNWNIFASNAWSDVSTFETGNLTGDGSSYVGANADLAGSSATLNTYLQAPSFSTYGCTAASLSFNYFLHYMSGSDVAIIEYSTDNTTWSTLYDYNVSGPASPAGSLTWTAGTPTQTIALPSGALGQPTVYLRWHYVSNFGYYWALDNVVVRTTSTGSSTTFTESVTGGTWSSSNTAVATVAAGVVTGLTAGTTTISYTNTCGTNAQSVTVKTSPVAITGSSVVAVGANTTLANASSGGTWVSLHTALATVDATTGVVTGVAAGLDTITYSTGCGATAIFPINVTNPCTGTPTPGTVSTTASTSCLAFTPTLSLSGATIAGGIGYQWKSSADSVTFTNVSGATNSTYSPSVTTGTFYECVLTCSYTGLSATTPAIHETLTSYSTFPASENFDGSTSIPCGWQTLDANSDGTTWYIDAFPPSGGSSPNALAYQYDVNGNAADDWAFTPPISMISGHIYRLTFKYGTEGFSTEGLQVKLGTAATAAGMTTTLFTNASITSSTLVSSGNIDMTAPSTGTFYIGFHCNSASFEDILYVDDVNLQHFPPCVTPTSTATGVTCAPATGITTTLSFTPASPVVDSYLVVATTAGSLTSGPVNGTHYAIGATLGGGKVIALSAGGSTSSILTSVTAGLAYNTAYNVFIYSFAGITCSGAPTYYATPSAVASFTTCVAPPAAPTASATAPGTTTLTWSTIAGATGFVVNAYTNSAASGSPAATSGSLSSATLSYAFTGLTNGVTYWFQVVANTSSCDATSAVTQVAIPYGNPYYESFDIGSVENTLSPDNMQGNTAPGVSGGYPFGGVDNGQAVTNGTTFATVPAHTGTWDYVFQGKYQGSTYTDNWLVTPPVYLVAGTTYTFSFWYVTDYGYEGTGTTYKWSSLKSFLSNVGTLPANTSAVMSGSAVGGTTYPVALSTAVTNAAATGWTQQTTTFTVPVTGTYYAGILAASNTNSSYLAVDDIAICTAPTGLTATNSPHPVCQNGTLSLSASGTAPSGYTYTWSGATTATGSVTSVSPMPATPANPVYSVTLSSDAANTCKVTATTTATVVPVPTAITPTSSFVCPGSTVTLAGGGAAGAFWSTSVPGQATVSTAGVVTALASPSPALSAGLTPITVTYNNSCGTPTTTVVNIGNSLTPGTYTVGVGQQFPTLTSAIAAYNSSCATLTGNVIFSLTDATYSTSETFPITIGANAGSTNTLTIQPASGVSTTISGSSTAILVLNGANNVIIEGSNAPGTNSVCPASASSQNLTISNTATTAGTGAVVWMQTSSGGTPSTNNIVRNCIITGSGVANTLIGVGSGGTTISLASTGNGNNNNQIVNNTISGVGTGVYSMGASAAAKNSGTIINQNTMTTASGIGANGILVGFEDGITISGNTIKNMTTAGNTDIVGINAGYPNNGITATATTGNEVTNATITNNVLGTISGTGTASAAGIAYASAATGTTVIANNEIFSILSRATVAADLTAGIYSGGGSGSSALNVWYNSILLTGASGGGTASSYGIAFGGASPATTLKSNIIENVATGTSGSALAIGLGFSSYSGFTSNNNDFVTTAAPLAGVGSLTAPTTQAALSDWQTTTAQDASSFSLVPSFSSSAAPIDLHMVSGAGNNPTLNNNGAASGAPVSTDFNCSVRGTFPDMGINEFNGAPAPTVTISTAPPASSCPSANVNISATVVTATGSSSYALTTSGTYMPRIYFSKNGTSWNSVPAVSYTGSTADGGNSSVWLFTIHPSDFTAGTTGVLNGGETIRYYVVAQDQSAPAGVGSAPGNAIATDVNTILAAPTTPGTYTYGYGTGTYSVGTGQTFTTITSALGTVYSNSNTCLSGPVTFLVTSNITEPAAVTIPTLTTTVPLTIKPAVGVSPTITASVTTATFILNGASQVTIDGSYGTTTNSLCPLTAATQNMTIKNTNAGTSSAIIELKTGASNNVIRNCILTGSGVNKTLFGIVSGGAAISTTTRGSGNNYNRFENNAISLCQNGIYTSGASAGTKNVGNVINQNTMNTTSGIKTMGVSANFEDSLTVSGNTIGNFVVATGATYSAGISLGFGPGDGINAYSVSGNDVSNATISYNKVDAIFNTGTYDAFGIVSAGVSSGTSVITIANNMVSRTMSDGTGGDFSAGIFLAGADASVSTSSTNIYYNSIYQFGSPGATDGSGVVAGIAINSSSTSVSPIVNIKNNVVSVTTTSGSGIKVPLAIEASSFTNLHSASNDLYSSSGPVATVDGAGEIDQPATTYSSLAAWTAASGEDTALSYPPVGLPITTPHGSVVAAPAFMSGTAPVDLRLTTSSANYLMNNTGTPVAAVTSDFVCATRDASYPDMGVNEITVNPAGCTSTVPGTVSASVTGYCVSGSPTMTLSGASSGTGAYYQWQSSATGTSGWTNISGATNTTYTPSAVTATTYYQALVACLNVSPVAQTQSTPASVTIAPQPAITSLSVTPSGTSICSGAAISLTGTATGGYGTPTYTWSGPGLTATTGSTLTSPTLNPTVSATATGAYSMTVSYSGAGCTASTAFPTAAVYTVSPQPAVTGLTVAPSALNICSGSSITLTGTATGGAGTATYTWTGPGISATTGSSLVSPALTPTATGTTSGAYSMTVSYSGTGCTSSAPFATTAVYTVSSQPATYTVTGGNGCSGAGIDIGLSNSDTGFNYQLLTGGVTTGSPIAGTGFALDFGIYNIPGTYTIAAANGGCNATMTGSSIIAATPSVVLGAMPNVCTGTSGAVISYSGASGSPTSYSIVYDATAHSAGFTDVTNATLSGGTITLAIPPSTPANTYNGTFTVSNSSCTSTSSAISLNIAGYATAAITSATPSCAGTSTSVVFTGTSGSSISYQVNHGSTQTGTLTGGTFSLSTGAISSNDTITFVDVHNGACITPENIDTIIRPVPMVWTGTADTSWNNAANWSCGTVPDTTNDVTIPSGTPFAPAIAASGSGTTRNLTIASGVALNLYSSSVVNVKGNLSSNAAISGAGVVSLSGTSAQRVSGIGSITNVDVNNTAGVSVDTGSRLTVTRSLGISGGTLTTNDSLVLASDSIATARIKSITASGAGISGNVQVRQFVLSGQRAYRFVGHPFNSSIPLSQIENYIDITGAGGALNGFTGTSTNAASAFRYDPTAANSASAYDPGWKAYTDANGTADSNRFHQYQGIRLFFRGYKGQGLDGYPYTPGDATWGMKGAVNQGDQNVTMVKGTGTNQDYNMIGNPYASPVDIGTVVHNAYNSGRITGSYIWIWNPYLGSVGNFQAKNITAGTPYSLEAYASFQVRAANNGDQLNFTESNKTATADQELLKAPVDYLSLYVYDANYHPWDMLSFQFDNAATDAEDLAFDAAKPSSPAGLNFYSKSSDGKNIMVDVRPYAANKVVPLGITSSYAQDFIIKVGSVAQLPAGGSVYLHDKLLNQYVLLNEGAEYKFSITADKATQGENRFELSMAPAEVAGPVRNALQVSMLPNPATDKVTLTFTSGRKDHVSLRILDLSGVSIYQNDLGLQQNGSIAVPLTNVASGIYMVEMTFGDQKVVKRLVKE